MDCHLVILREQIETWEEVVDKNLSRLNQLVSYCCVQLVVWLAEDALMGNSTVPPRLTARDTNPAITQRSIRTSRNSGQKHIVEAVHRIVEQIEL